MPTEEEQNANDEAKNIAFSAMLVMNQHIDQIVGTFNYFDGRPLGEVPPEMWLELVSQLPAASAYLSALKESTKIAGKAIDGEELDFGSMDLGEPIKEYLRQELEGHEDFNL